MKPTIGRIVHFQPTEGPTAAALITAVHEGDEDDAVSLQGFPANFPHSIPVWYVKRADEPTPGHWNWPPQV